VSTKLCPTSTMCKNMPLTVDRNPAIGKIYDSNSFAHHACCGRRVSRLQ
jgi:hypothetical protein